MFTDAELAYLSSQRLGRIATVAPDGTVQNSPVGFVVDADQGVIQVFGRNLARSRKFTNLALHPQVAFVVDDLASVQPWVVRGIELRGSGQALVDVDSPMPHFSREMIRIVPSRIISWGIEPGVEGQRGRNV